jgi:hypothetical protein
LVRFVIAVFEDVRLRWVRRVRGREEREEEGGRKEEGGGGRAGRKGRAPNFSKNSELEVLLMAVGRRDPFKERQEGRRREEEEGGGREKGGIPDQAGAENAYSFRKASESDKFPEFPP